MDRDDKEMMAIARYNAVMEHLSQSGQSSLPPLQYGILSKFARKQARIQEKRERKRALMAKLLGRENAKTLREAHRKLRRILSI